MIAEPRKTGVLGELYAGRYLREKGYKLLSANFRTKSGEIDIISEKDNTICFVEVKTRREGAFFDPAFAVDSKKEENVKSTAAAFIAMRKYKKNIRFDIIEVIMGESGYSIRHTENAF